jgi:predicted nucleotidyltransferase
MVTRSVIETARYYLRIVRENGIPVSFGVLFGSQARGTAKEDSDIDLLVVSPHFDGKKDFNEVDALWRLTARTDTRWNRFRSASWNGKRTTPGLS